MRVALVSEHANPLAALGGEDAGGQNVHVAALAIALAERGVTVTVHTRRDAPGPRRVALAPGVSVDHVPAGPARPVPKDELVPYMDEFARELGRAWRRHTPDVVHGHFWMSGRAALAAAAPLGVPVVQTFHALGTVKRRMQGSSDSSPPARVAQEKAIVAAADHLIATCSDETFELTRMGALPERMTVVPCGVDLSLFNPDGPAVPRHAMRHRLAVVGRLVPRKGVADVIAALAEVPSTELLIAGGPPAALLDGDEEACRLRRLAAERGLGDRVRLLGGIGRHQVAALLRSADAVVAVPWYEPFGMVALEAMASGVPVVASQVGGFVDSVVDGVTGVLVPPRDPEALASVLRGLLGDAGRRAALGAAGRRRAAVRYSWDRIGARTEAVYAGVAAGSPAVRQVVLR